MTSQSDDLLGPINKDQSAPTDIEPWEVADRLAGNQPCTRCRGMKKPIRCIFADTWLPFEQGTWYTNAQKDEKSS